MKYEAPELNSVTAIRAIQNTIQSKCRGCRTDFVQPNPTGNEPGRGYADWE